MGETKMEKHAVRTFIYGAVVLGILPLAGCLMYHSNVSYSGKGEPIADGTLDQIECGTTTKDWIVATLGEPSRQNTTANGTEILEYQYGKKRDNEFVFIPFVFINGGKENKQTVYFEISDGVVKNFWKQTSRR
jgi:outer membrane protein assembly factor BamE (lipoprotein component of BamABCDE complex)